MTATDELRRLLDERGVEWTTASGSACYTAWATRYGMAQATDYGEEGRIVSLLFRCTPEQAIEATLGRGTCKVDSFADVRFTEEDNQGHDYEYATLAECSECGAILLMPPTYIWYDDDSLYAATNFCPNCGREVRTSAQDDG